MTGEPKECPICGSTLESSAIRDDRLSGGGSTFIGWYCPKGREQHMEQWPMSFNPRPEGSE